MDRVVIYRIEDQMLRRRGVLRRRRARASPPSCSRSAARTPRRCSDQMLEREMLRRREPMVVRDALQPSLDLQAVDHALRDARLRRRADHARGPRHRLPARRQGPAPPGDPRGVDELDRDALWAFAEGFGYAVERMQLLERLRAQGDEVRRADLADRVGRRRAPGGPGRARVGHARRGRRRARRRRAAAGRDRAASARSRGASSRCSR